MKPIKLILLPALLSLIACGGSTNSSVESQISSSMNGASSSSFSSIVPPEVSSDVLSSEQPLESVPSLDSSEAISFESEAVSEEHSEESFVDSIESEQELASEEDSSFLPAIDPSALYGGYYKGLVSWTDSVDLRDQLHSIISGGDYTPIPYAGSTPNWDSNRMADQDLFDHEYLDVVYSSDNVDKDATNSKWQREHAFCASLMTGSTTANAVKQLGRATDFHNLFASASSANSSRGNKNFGEANKLDETYQDRTVKRGEDGYSFDAKVFEPGDKDKGRLARAIFYMATMYCEETYDEKNSVTMKPLQIVEEDVSFVPGDDCAFAIGHLSTLLSWSEYPVDLMEYQHNESVYSFVPKVHSDPAEDVAQGNRNPFVDFPELVDYAFGNKKDEPGDLASLISSYESLDIGEEGVSHCAIEKAKRAYSPEEPFSLSDLSVVAVNKDLSEIPYSNFTINGATDSMPFPNTGLHALEVVTEYNSLFYEVNVFSDYIESAIWKHKVTAKSAGDDFEGIADKNGVVHTLDFDGVLFDVTFEAGAVAQNSAKLGCKFGTASVPVRKLTFTTHDEFSFNGLSNIDWVYLRGATASNCSYDVEFFVGEERVAKKAISYAGQNETSDIGVLLNEPKQGKVSIVISNITNAVYVQYLAINAM